MDRILIRKLVNNIFSESQYIDTMMELADRKNPDSAIALSPEEMREIVFLLSQADDLHDYLKEHGVLSVKDEINNRSVKEIVQLLANNLISEETGYGMITNLLNANADTKLNTGTEEKTGEWIFDIDDLFPEESTQTCSVCHATQFTSIINDNYCPNCGTKMKNNYDKRLQDLESNIRKIENDVRNGAISLCDGDIAIRNLESNIRKMSAYRGKHIK